MTKQEILDYLDNVLHPIVSPDNWNVYSELHDMIEELPSAEPQMTVAEYRERMIQAFHNADCDSLIAIVALPTEKEFQHLEWLLKKEYVPFLERANGVDAVPVVRCCECKYFREFEKGFSSDWDGSCRYWNTHSTVYSNFCGCGARMDEERKEE